MAYSVMLLLEYKKITKNCEDNTNKSKTYHVSATRNACNGPLQWTFFVSSNIPLDKLDHLVFQHFLKQYCTMSPSSTSSASSGVAVHIPSSSILRKKYVNKNYQSTIELIKKYIEGEYFWISVDETTDSKGRYIC